MYYDIPLKEFLDKELIRKENKKKKVPQIYFTQITEDAIIEYINSTDQKFRDQIYKEKIQHAFYKLSENIIHTFKFYYTDLNTFEDLKHEVITFLLEKLNKYKADKGKAYSYFGTIAKRYLITYNSKSYNKLQNQFSTNEIDTDDDLLTLTTETNEEFDNTKSFLDIYVEYIDKNLYRLFPKVKDQKTVDQIMELFRKRESLNILEKKALYLYLREMGDIPTTHITKINKKLKKIYNNLYNIYYKQGHI